MHTLPNTAETSAIYQLQDEGKTMRAGQILQYVITDYHRKNSRRRAIPVALINEKTTYDSRRYTPTVSNSMQFAYRAIWIFCRALMGLAVFFAFIESSVDCFNAKIRA